MSADAGQGAGLTARAASGVLGFVIYLVIALAAVLLADTLDDLGLRSVILILAGMVAIMLAMAMPNRVAALLFLWVFAITYNRHIYSFDEILGDHGSQGLYWLPSDPILFLLVIARFFERGMFRNPHELIAPPVWPLYGPLLGICALSSIYAIRPEWGAFEMIRLLKTGLTLMLLRKLLRPTEWWTIVSALAVIVLVQGAFGILQSVAGGEGGTLGAFGLSAEKAGGARGEVAGRARGTLGHPNIFAPFFLQIVPPFVAMALMVRNRIAALAIGGIATAGLLALVASRSRMPVAVIGLDIFLILIAGVAIKRISIKRAAAMVVLGTTMISLAALPIADKIYERLTGDFKESVEFRQKYNVAAIEMWMTSPILGIGLNNFQEELGRYEPLMKQINQEIESNLRKRANLRTSAPVHNVYLLMLSETGLLGLFAYLVFLLGTIARGIWAVRRTDGAVQAACLGLTTGLVGHLFQQMVDFSLWYDASMLAMIIALAMFSTAPYVSARPPWLARFIDGRETLGSLFVRPKLHRPAASPAPQGVRRPYPPRSGLLRGRP
ncbi:MAG: O-antigen ligase family protein [Alphaproteobacteria bacterium]|nr:O-antigen ligase family protein [Alphaproteobacteria bacterium]